MKNQTQKKTSTNSKMYCCLAQPLCVSEFQQQFGCSFHHMNQINIQIKCKYLCVQAAFSVLLRINKSKISQTVVCSAHTAHTQLFIQIFHFVYSHAAAAAYVVRRFLKCSCYIIFMLQSEHYTPPLASSPSFVVHGKKYIKL